MENQNVKCSSKKHAEIDAVSYCPECEKYLCNKCLNFHAEMLEGHKTIKLNEKKEIFIDKCKEENHKDKLEFYCKEHNTLCCTACITKIKAEGYGQHSECNVIHIKEIKDEKRNKLKENINNLDELYKHIDQSLDKLKEIFEQINKNKDDIKLKVQSIFNKLRNALNEREDKLLLEIEEYYNKTYFKEDIIKKSEKLPNKIKKSLEKGKIIDQEWNDNNLSSFINYCINIENNIDEINILNDNINKCDSNEDIKIVYNITEEEINSMLDNINNFGNIITEYNYDNYKIELKILFIN